MDSGASNRHPNHRKQAQFSSNSMKDSNLIIPSLPPELITEILLRLPVKSLLKFRSVSKSWLSLISSPKFIKNHLHLLANNKENTYHMLILVRYGTKWNFKECLMRSLFYDSVSEAFDLYHPFGNDDTLVRIVGCCNGLICLADYSGCSLLWNPTTRIHKNLPDFRPRWKFNFSHYGLGYDELSDDYKVVSVFYNYGGSDGIEAKIYSLKSDSWTSVDYCYEETFVSSNENIRLSGSGFFVNGKFHWDTLVVGRHFIDNTRQCKNIISFYLANEKWEKMEKPSYGVGETELCVGMLGSDLSVFSDYKRIQLGVWVMNDYGVTESWIKKYTIRYPINQVLYPPFFMSNEAEILSVFASTSVVYNLKDEVFRYPHVINCNDFHGVGMYVESLVCPFSTEVTEDQTKTKVEKSADQNNRVTNNCK